MRRFHAVGFGCLGVGAQELRLNVLRFCRFEQILLTRYCFHVFGNISIVLHRNSCAITRNCF